MFGILRPCRNRLGDELRTAWMAHLCGMCLALRDGHGHLARLVTNYDAVVISALVEAQAGADGRRRDAGICALRGMKGASVAVSGGAELAASVSLLLAAAKLGDKVADGEITGPLRTRATRQVAARLAGAGQRSGADVALDSDLLLGLVADQAAVERTATHILEVTAPTEAATALAFGQTAIVAGRPGNADALAEAGRLFGRVAHLLDAVEDLHADRRSGAWNPISALALSPSEVRGLCGDAALGVRLALRDVEFADARLVHVLLVHELESAIDRIFTSAGAPTPPLTPPLPPNQQPPGAPPDEDTPGWPPPPTGVEPPARNPVLACAGWLVVCGTCQVCCAEEWENPCNGKRYEGVCRNDCCCDCGCDGCDDCCCDGCDC